LETYLFQDHITQLVKLGKTECSFLEAVIHLMKDTMTHIILNYVIHLI